MMNFNLLNIGFGNVVMGDKVVAIISPESAPIKRLVQDARDGNTLIDATFGRKTRSGPGHGQRLDHLVGLAARDDFSPHRSRRQRFLLGRCR